MPDFQRSELRGTVEVPLPATEALALFTPCGERRWAPGWDPVFPAATADDTAPGTVFLTSHGADVTTWVVAGRAPQGSVTYANVLPGVRASRIEVICEAAGRGGSVATVTYQVTPLSERGARWLRAFAADYPAFMRHWEEAIAAALVQ